MHSENYFSLGFFLLKTLNFIDFFSFDLDICNGITSAFIYWCSSNRMCWSFPIRPYTGGKNLGRIELHPWPFIYSHNRVKSLRHNFSKDCWEYLFCILFTKRYFAKDNKYKINDGVRCTVHENISLYLWHKNIFKYYKYYNFCAVNVCFQGSPTAHIFAKPTIIARLARFTLEVYSTMVRSLKKNFKLFEHILIISLFGFQPKNGFRLNLDSQLFFN